MSAVIAVTYITAATATDINIAVRITTSDIAIDSYSSLLRLVTLPLLMHGSRTNQTLGKTRLLDSTSGKHNLSGLGLASLRAANHSLSFVSQYLCPRLPLYSVISFLLM